MRGNLPEIRAMATHRVHPAVPHHLLHDHQLVVPPLHVLQRVQIKIVAAKIYQHVAGQVTAVVQRDSDEAVFEQQVTDIMASSQAPTAIVASNSMVALSLVQVLQKLKVRWPDDVTLLAFDEPVWAPILSPPLSVVRHPTQRIALEAWNRLLARTRTPGLRPKRITLEAKLVATQSIGPPRSPRP